MYRSARIVVLTALGYWLTGKLGLMLAIPPGYATAVWPAAGVAFAALMVFGIRHWPGVLLGSFVVNIGVAFDGSSTEAIVHSLAVALGIGSGAAIQAVVGVLLVRRWVGRQPALDAPRDVVLFMCLAGPVACLVNATVAQLVLVFGEAITWAQLPFSAWVWWTGDVMGVVAMAPMVMAFWAKPESVWRHRRLTVVAPLMVVYLLLVAGFFLISAKELGRLQDSFNRQSQAVLHGVVQNLEREFLFADTMAAQVRSHGLLDEGEWQRMQEYLVPYRADRSELAWLDAQAGRGPLALMHARVIGIPESAAPSGLTACSAFWSELDPTVEIAGYPQLLEAMQVARDTGRGALSAPLRRHSAPNEQPSCVAYLSPVFNNDANSVAERRSGLLGFALSFQSVSHQLQRMRLDVNGRFAVSVRDTALGESFASIGGEAGTNDRDFHWTSLVTIGQRNWAFNFDGVPNYGQYLNTWQAWVALAGGVTITSILGMFLMVVGGQTVRVRQLVNERTQALAEANENLQHAVERNSALVDELQHTNKELEQFAYVASHDLREPLRTIESFVSLLGNTNPDARTEEEKTFLRFITEGVVRMQSLIEDLLQYSRVGRAENHMQLVDMNKVLEDVRSGLQRSITENNAVIRADTLPTVLGDPLQLGQVFQNILSNSLKYRGARDPEIEIQVQQLDSEWEIRCGDNGIGFDPAKADLVFEPFKRLHEGGRFEGTGIGMAIVAKIIRQMGGTIRADAVEGEGATMIIRLPVSARTPVTPPGAG